MIWSSGLVMSVSTFKRDQASTSPLIVKLGKYDGSSFILGSGIDQAFCGLVLALQTFDDLTNSSR